jgi:hypothetical protein
MVTSSPNEYKQLTSDLLVNLLLDLPEDAGTDHDQPKRLSCRWLLRAPAEISLPDTTGEQVRHRIHLRDVSMTGIGVICMMPIPVNIRGEIFLPLEDGLYKVSVRVMHCTETVGGYRIGCHFLLPDAPTMVPMINRALLTQEDFEQSGQ